MGSAWEGDVGDGGALGNADVFTTPFLGIWVEALHHLLAGLEEMRLGFELIEPFDPFDPPPSKNQNFNAES